MVKTLTVIVFLYALYSLFRISSTYAPDFSVFYDAAKGLVAHQNIYTLPMYTGLGYPPFTLLPFIPFTLVPYRVAQTIWIVLSFLAFLYCIYLSMNHPTFIKYCVIFIFSFLAFPTKFTLGMGQVNFFALLFLLLALRYKSGIFLGGLFVLKPHFLLFVPLFKRNMIMPAIVIIAISIVFTGFTLYPYYLQHVVPQLMVFVGRGIYYNQGLGAFLSRLVPNTLAGGLTFWISALFVVSALWFIWNKKVPLWDSVMLFLPTFLLVEPLSWQHHYVFLLPVYVWLTEKMKHKTEWILFSVSYVLVAMNFSSPPAFILSHVFFGNLLLLSLVGYEMAQRSFSR